MNGKDYEIQGFDSRAMNNQPVAARHSILSVLLLLGATAGLSGCDSDPSALDESSTRERPIAASGPAMDPGGAAVQVVEHEPRSFSGIRIPLDASVLASYRALNALRTRGIPVPDVAEDMQNWLNGREARCGLDPAAAIDPKSLSIETQRCVTTLDLAQARVFGKQHLGLLLALHPRRSPLIPPEAPGLEIEVNASVNARTFDHAREVVAVSWDRGEHLRTGGVDFIDYPTGRVAMSTTLDFRPLSGDFSFNDRVFFVSSFLGDRPTPVIAAIDVESGAEIVRVEGVQPPFRATRDGLLVSPYDDVTVIDPLTDRTIHGDEPSLGIRVSVSRKDHFVTGGGKRLVLWQIDKWQHSLRLTKRKQVNVVAEEVSDFIRFMEFTPDDNRLLVGTSAGRLAVYRSRDLTLEAAHEMLFLRIAGDRLIPVDDHWYALPIRYDDERKTLLWNPADMTAALSPELIYGEMGGNRNTFGAWLATNEKFVAPEPWQANPLADVDQGLAAAIAAEASETKAPFQHLEGVTIEAIGVYEGRKASMGKGTFAMGSGVPQENSPVDIAIGETPQRIVLVLASADPVHWILTTHDANIHQILLSGDTQSAVIGSSKTETIYIGDAYAYSPNSDGYRQLNKAVKLYTGRDIDRFQGSYKGDMFSIGTDAPRRLRLEKVEGQLQMVPAPAAPPSGPPRIFRRTGPDGKTEFSDKPFE
jgi:hypothetical protein